LDYKKQSEFLTRYRILAVYIVVVVGAVFGWIAVSSSRVDLVGQGASMALSLVLAWALYYLPLYLRLSTDVRKRFAWGVRIRWIGIPVVALLALVRAESLHDVAIIGEWSSALLGANYVARLLLKSGVGQSLEFVPAVHVVVDLAVLALIAPSDSLPTFVALGFAYSGALFVVSTSGIVQIVGAIFCAAIAFVRLGPFRLGDQVVAGELVTVAGPLVALTAALVLTRVVERQNDENVNSTVLDLARFGSISPDSAAELLETSTGILARSWNESQPKEESEVAKWYSDNSRYYLYDLAQFHLAYKHIAFSLDVLGLANGTVLDYGAGIGDLTLELARRGHDVTYVDVPGETQGFARWRSERDELSITFARTLEEATGPFDTIISLDVLEHLREPEPVIDALVERLAPGGTFVVTAYFGPTKSHPMHFDHDLDLAKYLRARGLRDIKGIPLQYFKSEIMRKSGVLVFAK